MIVFGDNKHDESSFMNDGLIEMLEKGDASPDHSSKGRAQLETQEGSAELNSSPKKASPLKSQRKVST